MGGIYKKGVEMEVGIIPCTGKVFIIDWAQIKFNIVTVSPLTLQNFMKLSG